MDHESLFYPLLLLYTIIINRDSLSEVLRLEETPDSQKTPVNNPDPLVRRRGAASVRPVSAPILSRREDCAARPGAAGHRRRFESRDLRLRAHLRHRKWLLRHT